MFAKHKNFDYYYHLPEGYTDGMRVPILFSMHGAGRRMNAFDQKAFLAGFEGYVDSGAVTTDCVVITPACPSGKVWFDIFEQLKEFIEDMIVKFNGIRSRIYLMGISMGGYCSWQLLMSMPQVFERAVIMCGGGMYWNAGNIKAEVRAYHGTEDPCVFPEESVKMCNAVNAAGGKATLFLLEGLSHNVWDTVCSDQSIIDWLTKE